MCAPRLSTIAVGSDALNGRRRLVPNLLGERFQQTTMPLTAIQHARAIGVLLGTAAGDGKYV